jgi:hypothetical protein
MLFGQRRVHQPPRVLAQRLQLARQALALRLVLDDEPAIAGPPAVVGGRPQERLSDTDRSFNSIQTSSSGSSMTADSSHRISSL